MNTLQSSDRSKKFNQPLVTPAESESHLELTVVMPCLNEADTIEVCVVKALTAIREAGIDGEVLIADNGSTDGSQLIAERLGARVVQVEAKGYGNALMGGIAAARGKYIIMGDADDSYNFEEIPKFVERLRRGPDLVQGCRLPSGGGSILPGAMPFLHRWWGNPMFSVMVRQMFNAPIHDVYCGMRGFTKEAYDKLDLRCTGMEFATEMIIKASRYKMNIAEVPITLHPDGRKAHAPHLKTFRDGWRTLRFFLMCSPRWLFLIPGIMLFLFGLIGYGLAMPGVTLGGATVGAHTLLVASLALLTGQQAIFFAIFAKMFSINEGLMPPDQRMNRFFDVFTLERGLILGGVAVTGGICLIGIAMNVWRANQFGALDYAHTMRLVIPGVTLVALGFQGVLSSFVVSILGMHHK